MIASSLQALLLTLVVLGSANTVHAQTESPPASPPPAGTPQARADAPSPDAAPSPDTSSTEEPAASPSTRRDSPCGGRIRNDVVRVGQDYVVGREEAVSGLTVVLGSATVEGAVCGDLVVVMGKLTLGPEAWVDANLVAVGGAVQAADGAEVRGDLVVVGGGLDASPSFGTGGERVVVGVPVVGDRLMAIGPWLTRGLLLGRLIVPDLPGNWYVVGVIVFVLLILNLLFPGATAAATVAIQARPLSTFAVGLLVLLLSGPFLTLLAITVIGVLAIPVLACGLVAAAFIGAIAVARWIGTSIVAQDEPAGRFQATTALALGLLVLVLAFMVPVLGITTWALTSVLGLGAATTAFISAFRAENPARAARGAAPGAPSTVAPTADLSQTDPPLDSRFADLSIDPVAAATAEGPAVPRTPPVVPPPALPLAPSPVPLVPSDLRLMPKATFLERVAAIALDVLLVGLLNALLGFTNGAGSFVLLLVTYHVVLWAWKTTTVGGIICQLRIVRVDGQPLQFADGLIRGLTAVLSFAALGLGQFWILRDPDQQAWHDKVAGTWVVKVPRDWPLP